MTTSHRQSAPKTAADKRYRAALLTARLYSGSLEPKDENELEEWLVDDTANRDEYDDMLSLWDQAAGLQHHLHELEPAESVGRRYWGRISTAIADHAKTSIAVAAGIICVVSLAMAIEAQAMDLYMRAADRSDNPRGRKVLSAIADEERTHLDLLGKLLENLP